MIDLVRLFFSCQIKRRALIETVVTSSDGKQTVFPTKEDWDAFCFSFLGDAEKVFKYHLYEYRAEHEGSKIKKGGKRDGEHQTD